MTKLRAALIFAVIAIVSIFYGLAIAANIQFRLTLPTTRIDGSPLLASDISETRVYCDTDTTFFLTGAMEVIDTDLPVGIHACYATIVDSDSQESDPSNTVTFEIKRARPSAPVSFEFVGSADAQVIVVAPDDTPPPNSPPVWGSTPAPTFTEGVASSYGLSGLYSDADGDAITISNESGCTLPTGVTIDNTAKELDASTGTSAGTTTSCVFGINDGTAATVNSSPFSIVIGAAPGGNYDHGDQYVLTGTGFEVVVPGLWDTVDNISAYSGLSDGNTIPTTAAYPWSINTFNNPDRVKYETTSGNMRSSVSTAAYRGATPAYLQWPRATGGEGGAPGSQKELYVSYWIYPDATIPAEGHSSKFIRYWDDPNGGGTRTSWTQMHLDYDLAGSGSAVSWNNWGGSSSAWNRLELYVNLNNGTLDTFTNGDQIHNVSNAGQNSGGVGTGINVSRIGFDTGGTSPPSLNIDFDDIYVATSPGRVELCDSATWSSRTHCEIQPATGTPSATSVTIIINRGSFTSGTYDLFTIDGDNVATHYGTLTLN